MVLTRVTSSLFFTSQCFWLRRTICQLLPRTYCQCYKDKLLFYIKKPVITPVLQLSPKKKSYINYLLI